MSSVYNKNSFVSDDEKEERKANHSYQRNKFTMTEDKLLKELVEMYGTNSWAKIAEIIPNRNSRQCHDRWVNYLSPNINKNPWTEEEELLLLSAIEQIGLHWVKIAKKMPGRTDIQIKNRWNVIKRRRAADLKTIMQYKAYFSKSQENENESNDQEQIVENNQNEEIKYTQEYQPVQLVNHADNKQQDILINIPFDSIFNDGNDFEFFEEAEWF